MGTYKNSHAYRALYLDPLYKTMSNFDAKDRAEALNLYKLEFAVRAAEVEEERRLAEEAAAQKAAADKAAAAKAAAEKIAAQKAAAEREGLGLEVDRMDVVVPPVPDEDSDDIEDPFQRRHDARIETAANIERSFFVTFIHFLIFFFSFVFVYLFQS